MEHSIRTWVKLDGTWDVTHHAGKPNQPHLWDVKKDFQNFPTRDLAEKYAFSLFKRFAKKGNFIEISSPDSFGEEINCGWGRINCGWGRFEGDSWLIRKEANGKMFFWSSPNLANDKTKIPSWILKELKRMKIAINNRKT